MLSRRFAAILLLLFATGNAAAPRHPDSPVGRLAFDNCLASAETAWRSGRTAEALRWYHSAKKVARAHNLTLTGRDTALVDFITRHEAGLAGPQPGRKPGCETDGTAGQTAGTTNPLPRVRRIAADSQAAIAKVIPPLEPTAEPFPKSRTRTIPGDTADRPLASPSETAAEATAQPATTAIQPDEPPASEPETAPSDTPQPAIQHTSPPVPPSPPGPVVGDEPNTPQEPAPPNWPDSESAADPEAPDPNNTNDANEGDDLVPPVTPLRTSAPPAPPAPPRPIRVNDESQTSATDTADSPGAPVAKASDTNPQAVEHPVRLTADESAVPIQRPNSPPPTTPPPTDDATSTSLSQQFLGSFNDQELIMILFGPIVLALFILGLLTREMPGPMRILAWIRRRVRRSDSPRHARTDEVSAGSIVETVAKGQIGEVMLTVRIGKRRHNKVDFYTATIELPGLEPTRVVKRRDGSPLFHSKGAAANSARHTALRLGFDGIVEPAARRKAA